MDDTRASMSAKKVSELVSPVTRRCAFVGHLRNAENIAAVMSLFVLMAVSLSVAEAFNRVSIAMLAVSKLRVCAARDQATRRRGVGHPAVLITLTDDVVSLPR